MSNYNYGGGNPYDQRGRDDGYGGGYGQGGYDQGAGGYGQPYQDQEQGGYVGGYQPVGHSAQGGDSMEMTSGGDITVLNEVNSISKELNRVAERHQLLRSLHNKAAYEAGNEPDSRTNQEITRVLEEIRVTYQDLGERMRNLASKPEAQSGMYKEQFEHVKRAFQQSVQRFATLQSDLGKEKDEEVARQFRIVHGNPPEEEVRRYMDAVHQGQEDPDQLFQQALLRSTRVEGANTKLIALKARNQALQQIERQMEELLQLFTQMDTIVMQQDGAVQQIEQKAGDAVENLDKGNQQMDNAVNSAIKARRKKWWCLGIVVAIIVVVLIIVLAYLGATGQLGGGGNDNNNAKRSLAGPSVSIRGGPARLLTDRSSWPPSRIVGRGFVPLGLTDEEHVGPGGAVDI